MSDDSLEGRLQKVELRFAYLTGAAAVGLAAALSFLGLTTWVTIPSAVEKGVNARITAETISTITEAEKKAATILSASELRGDVQKLIEASNCENPVSACVCKLDTGKNQAKLEVCISHCPDGRLREIEIKELIVSESKAPTCTGLNGKLVIGQK